MVKIGVVGTGFVGLTHAATTARFGHEVIAYDIDEKKITAFATGKKELIEKYVYELGLSRLIEDQLHSQRLKFTTNPNDLIDCEAIFLTLHLCFEYYYLSAR